MRTWKRGIETKELFETMPVPSALARMALPSIASQLVTLIYNIADTWFIGQTNNPYMVAASSLVLTIFFATTAIANLFGVGGGTLTARLLGSHREDEARKVASLTLVMAGCTALLFSLLWGAFPVFLITSLLAAAFDSCFAVMQRYNRPRLVRILEKKEAKARE